MSDLEQEFEREAEQPRAPASMAMFNAKMKAAIELKQRRDALDAEFSIVKSVLHKIATQELPAMMLEFGLEKCTSDGWDCRLEDLIEGGLPKDDPKQAVAIEHIKELGGEGILKTSITLEFPREYHHLAQEAYDKIRKLGFDPVIGTTVHYMTYQSFVRELLKNKVHFNETKLGVLVGKIVKFKPGKAK